MPDHSQGRRWYHQLLRGLDAFTLLPNGFNLTIPAAIDGRIDIGEIPMPLIDIKPTPGFGNSTVTPSSGFFNTGSGGGSGWGR